MLAKMTFAAILAVASVPAMAACDVTVESNDAMQFNTKEITIDKSCKEFTINLKHVGKLPKASMGHNIVITKKADEQAVATDGMAAGIDKDYVKPDDARVLAHTALIGGGESTSAKLDVSKLQAGEEYAFFCSFPGHWAVMTGKVVLGA